MFFLIQHKWSILLISEIIAWLLLIPTGYYRYWKDNKLLYVLSLSLSIFFGYVPHITLPIIVFIINKDINTLYKDKNSLIFIFFIFILVLYGATFGKKTILKIDNKVKEFATKHRAKM